MILIKLIYFLNKRTIYSKFEAGPKIDLYIYVCVRVCVCVCVCMCMYIYTFVVFFFWRLSFIKRFIDYFAGFQKNKVLFFFTAESTSDLFFLVSF